MAHDPKLAPHFPSQHPYSCSKCSLKLFTWTQVTRHLSVKHGILNRPKPSACSGGCNVWIESEEDWVEHLIKDHIKRHFVFSTGSSGATDVLGSSDAKRVEPVKDVIGATDVTDGTDAGVATCSNDDIHPSPPMAAVCSRPSLVAKQQYSRPLQSKTCSQPRSSSTRVGVPRQPKRITPKGRGRR
jgi:hypothetical protein